MGDSARDDVAAAWDELEKAEEGGGETAATHEPGAVDAPSDASTGVDAVPSDSQPELDPEEPGEAKEKPGRVRGQDGKFIKAPKEGAQQPGAPSPQEGQQEITPPPEPGTTSQSAARPPQSLSPELAEKHWANTPPEIQRWAAKREYETRNLANELGEARKVAETFGQILAPHQRLIQSTGAPATQLVSGLMNDLALMTTGQPQQKAAWIANIIHKFGVDGDSVADAFDAIKAGKVPPGAQPAPPPQQHVDPNQIAAQIEQKIEAREKARRIDSELQAWKATSPEHLKDPQVLQDMGILLDAADARGNPIAVALAYEKACRMNGKQTPAEKAAAEEARKRQAEADQRSRRASTSVRGSPSGVNGSKQKIGSEASARDTAAKVWDELAGAAG